MSILKHMWNNLTCKHVYKKVRTIHGDEIIFLNYSRSEWVCKKCGNIYYSEYLDRIAK